MEKTITISEGVIIKVNDLSEAIEYSDGTFAIQSKDKLYVFEKDKQGMYVAKFTDDNFKKEYLTLQKATGLFDTL